MNLGMMALRSSRQLYHRRTSKHETIYQITTAGHLSLQQVSRVLFGYLERPQYSRDMHPPRPLWSIIKGTIKESLRDTFQSEKGINFIDLTKACA